MKIIRYSKNNGALRIGGISTYLVIFTREKLARVHVNGVAKYNIGNWIKPTKRHYR